MSHIHDRVITKTLGLSSKRTGGTNLQQAGNHGHGSTQQSFPGPVLAPTHPLSFSTETKVKGGILFKDYCSWHIPRHDQVS